MGLGGEGAGKKQRAVVVAIEKYQRKFVFYAKEYRMNGGCSFIDPKRFCKYSHKDIFGRVDKEAISKMKEEAARVSGKRPDEESDGGTGERYSGIGEGMGFTSGRGERVWGVSPAMGEKKRDGRPWRRGGCRETGLKAAIAPGSAHVGENKNRE